ncbi:FAD-binding protein [Streptomyces radicis]|uniref:FAD-binding protein n=1 Tax=Streptomyces radicis TaxID=1750517 RepID=A0A3A9X1Y3_9ACTN|nr:FAD-binding protein [Streptomyces radicis]RKN12507.1 FAD-binding protein [Streptomyces radicis]RKN27725.1 FAD-binding protein [Streptomyces radicis]
MAEQPERTTELGTGAARAAVAFDPLARVWLTEAEVGSSRPDLAYVPRLDGSLRVDLGSLADDGDDFGHIVHHPPGSVLRTGSVDDIAAMIRFCDAHHIEVAARGQGHATFGQAQVAGGLVIETEPLSRIGPVGEREVTVGAGAVWSAVVKETLRHGLTPPVFTDYLELSVGGTLSVGGLGGQARLFGAQVDNVIALEVVTGAGEVVSCSPTRRPDLFRAVLAGLGQCAVIVSATLRLISAPATVRRYQLSYSDLETFLDDQRRLAETGPFTYVEGTAEQDENGAYTSFVIEAVAYGPPAGSTGTVPDEDVAEAEDVAEDVAEALRGLGYDGSGPIVAEALGYFDFLNRLASGVADLKNAGYWTWAHPWLNLVLPGDRAAELARTLLDGIAGQDVGPGGVVLLYPLVRRRLHTPLLRVPDDPVPSLMAVLWTLDPADPAAISARTAANRAAFETVRAAGGTQYPVGAVPMTAADWRGQYGKEWEEFAAAKRRYDPHGLLAPGQHIFTA